MEIKILKFKSDLLISSFTNIFCEQINLIDRSTMISSNTMVDRWLINRYSFYGENEEKEKKDFINKFKDHEKWSFQKDIFCQVIFEPKYLQNI